MTAVSTASPTVSRGDAMNAAASKGVTAIHAIGHHGCMPAAFEIIAPDRIAATRRRVRVSRRKIVMGEPPANRYETAEAEFPLGSKWQPRLPVVVACGRGQRRR